MIYTDVYTDVDAESIDVDIQRYLCNISQSTPKACFEAVRIKSLSNCFRDFRLVTAIRLWRLPCTSPPSIVTHKFGRAYALACNSCKFAFENAALIHRWLNGEWLAVFNGIMIRATVSQQE